MGGVGDFFQDTFDNVTGRSGVKAAERAADAQTDSGLAAIDEQSRQFDFIQELMAPFIEQGLGQSDNVTQGSTADGLDQRLAEISGSDAFAQINEERLNAANNAFSQSGLTRSGGAVEALSGIPLETALALEENLFQRQSGLFGNAQNAAAGLGSASQNTSNAISNLLTNNGNAAAQGIIGAQQASAAGTNNLLSLGTSFFSDPRLKKNMEPVGKIHDLTLYEWDWIDGLPDGVPEMSTGYNAFEVSEKYPQFTEEVGGFTAIDYHGLNAHLEEKLNSSRVY